MGTSYTGRDGAISPSVPLLFCAATFCFYVPFMREIFLTWGVVDASRHLLSAHLAAGHSIAVFPGGAAEARFARPGSAELTLAKRRGFIELALEAGAHLVPVYTFGEAAAMGVEPRDVLGFADLMRALIGIWMPPLFVPVRDRGCACTTVVGTPIPVERRGPGGYTRAEVDALLARYSDALAALYAEHVGRFGGPYAGKAIRVVE